MGTAIIEGRGGENADINVDPNVDPDLAMVLRISLEEENARVIFFFFINNKFLFSKNYLMKMRPIKIRIKKI